MSRIFGHGDLRLYLLKLLEEGERHGYEIIRLLEDRFLGMYSPSPGTVYPRLQALEEEGLVERRDADGRKVYRLTDRGRAELEARIDDVREVGQRVANSAREIAREIRDEVHASVRDLRRDLRDAARDVRREERRLGREVGQELRGSLRSLQADLEAFVSDVIAAARRHRLDRERLAGLRDVLLDARAAAIEALEGRRPHHP
jgi:DNA-binding PadR family transcriptional regulator